MAEHLIEDTPEYRLSLIDIDDGEGTQQERIARTRRLCEVNGWHIVEVREKGDSNYGPHFIIKKPRSAPDVTPFIDPNAPKA